MQETRISKLLAEARAHAAAQPPLPRPETPAAVSRQLTSRSSSRSILTRRLSALDTSGTTGASTSHRSASSGARPKPLGQSPITPSSTTDGSPSSTSAFQFVPVTPPTTPPDSASSYSSSFADCCAMISASDPASNTEELYDALRSFERAINRRGGDASKELPSDDVLKKLHQIATSELPAASFVPGSGRGGEGGDGDNEVARRREGIIIAAAVVLSLLLRTPPPAALRLITERVKLHPMVLSEKKLVDPLIQYSQRDETDITVGLMHAITALRIGGEKSKEVRAALVTQGIVPCIKAVLLRCVAAASSRDKKKRSKTSEEAIKAEVDPEVNRKTVNACLEIAKVISDVHVYLLRKLGVVTIILTQVLPTFLFDVKLTTVVARTLARIASVEEGAEALRDAVVYSSSTSGEQFDRSLFTAIVGHSTQPMIVSRLAYTAAVMFEGPGKPQQLLSADSNLEEDILSLVLVAIELAKGAVDAHVESLEGDVAAECDALQQGNGSSQPSGESDSARETRQAAKVGWEAVKGESLLYLTRLFANISLIPAGGQLLVDQTGIIDRYLVALTAIADEDPSVAAAASSDVPIGENGSPAHRLSHEILLCLSNLSYYLPSLDGDDGMLGIMLDMVGPILVGSLVSEDWNFVAASARALSNITACAGGQDWLLANRVDEALLLLTAHDDFRVQFSAVGSFINFTCAAESGFMQVASKKDSLLHQLSSIQERLVSRQQKQQQEVAAAAAAADSNNTARGGSTTTAGDDGDEVESILELVRQVRRNLVHSR